MRWIDVCCQAKASVCLVTALSLLLPPNLFAQGTGPSEPGGENHLRSTQVRDDPKNNPTLTGLEEALHRANQEAPKETAESPASISSRIPSRVPSGNFWAGHGQGPLPSSVSLTAGVEEGSSRWSWLEEMITELNNADPGRVEAVAA